ncbi:MAG: chorismate synthase [Verrucomicrobia bacterium]|nr:chorismate synthase [Verrucomicrobiota bacterium]
MSNSLGRLFRYTTFGESHGPAIGVVIDGCPAQLPLTCAEIDKELVRRRPGQPLTSPRKEPDCVEILSGVFEEKTTGAPICLLIRNCDVDSSKYEPIKDLLRPGHANSTYLAKYGHIDWRGGGRASARETVARVAAGAVAKKYIGQEGMAVSARLVEVGGKDAAHLEEVIRDALAQGDSVGAIVEVVATGVPPGLGDPIYEKLDAELAHALLSLPATKGFEIGSGFAAARMLGSEHNDSFGTDANCAGGVLGGISTGQPLVMRVAFKPTSSIAKPQWTLDIEGKPTLLELPQGSRHDPCVALRALPIVEANVALVLADRLLVYKAYAPCDRTVQRQPLSTLGDRLGE